jgi:hypothetical protein
MRQFVAVIPLAGGAVDYRVPDESYLHRLSEEEQERIRAMYGG